MTHPVGNFGNIREIKGEWLGMRYLLTPNMPLIQLWCARSKLNMDEICSLNIHL